MTTLPWSHPCPECGKRAHPVRVNLVRHHVKQPWARGLEGHEFLFCETTDCDLVYFEVDGPSFTTADIRRPPAYKTGNPTDLLCYCFDAAGDAVLRESDPVPYISERVRKSECACDVLNPSGDCCLGSIGFWRKARANLEA